MSRLTRLLAIATAAALAACAPGRDTAQDTAGAIATEDTTPSGRDLISVIRAEGGFDTFIGGVDSVGLGGELRGQGPYTIFAPTDAAFTALPDADRRALLGDSARLGRVIQYHVVPGRLTAADLQGMTSVTTLQGTTVPVRFTDGTLRVGDATVVRSDVEAENGIVHVVDGVLVPGR